MLTVRPLVALVLAGALGAFASPARAAVATGTVAPAFTAQAAQGGTISTFDLKAALAKGPVVLYFFPKAFTTGCTAEAHDFADHIGAFQALHATVVGVSADDIATERKFSTEECRAKFLVASDPGLRIAKSYDAVLADQYANRTSYVIAPDGKIVYTYTSLDPDKHVANTLAALRALEKP
jgi:thioredoxin-dependent peroxiredoxin